jgi:hypothetical protein
MSTVDDRFDRFRAAYRTGEEADPQTFLEGLAGSERRELEVLIDAFLLHAPGDADDEQALTAFRASPIGAGLRAAIDARMAETWPELLPRLRNEAELTRATLVQRLAGALGVGDRERKVGGYYHRMEIGDLEPAGVSDRVLEALGRIVGASAERLRAAGSAPPAQAAGGAVFARVAMPAAAAAPVAQPRREAERDEVDELFTGG